MHRIEGCFTALFGGAIAVFSVYGGLVGSFGAMQDVHPVEAWVCVGLGLLGCAIGLMVFVNGIVKAIFGN
jgi:hypothetical protein